VSGVERIRRHPGVLWRRSLDAVVLLPPGNAESYTLGGTGPVIWELLGDWRSEEDLVASLAEMFGADPAVVGRDLAPVLAALSERGALERSAS
jgi:hypothetical protein